MFFKIPAQLPPLTYDEVKKCLPDFLKKTATALQELHACGFAHLDVRLPNICFAQEDHNRFFVKLIDLDRCSRIHFTEDLSYGDCEMYTYPPTEQPSTTQLDWKQLGLLAGKAILDKGHKAIVGDHRVITDTFLSSLIFKGTYFVQ